MRTNRSIYRHMRRRGMHEAWSCSWTSAKWFPAKKHKAIVLFLGWRDNLKAENVQKSFAHIIFSNSNTFTIPNFEENSEHPPSCAHELMYRLDNPVNPEWQSTQTVVKMWISSIAMCGWLNRVHDIKLWWKEAYWKQLQNMMATHLFF